jgi:hypothetical protein
MAKKGKKKGSAAKPLLLKDAWTDLFVKNERAPKAKKLTDDQLSAAMLKLFPERAGKVTIVRVSAMRSNYNRGLDLFVKCGPAKVPSRRYDENGEVIEKGQRRSKKAKAAAAPKPRKKVVKKKVVKKAAKAAPKKKGAKKATKKVVVKKKLTAKKG